MKRSLIISALLIANGLYGQRDSLDPFKIGLSASYQNIIEESILGLTADMSIVYRWENGLRTGIGGTTGLMMTSVYTEEEIVFDHFLFASPSTLNASASGNLYLIPIEGYGLIGYEEDFLQIGAGLQYLQFSGTTEYDIPPETHTYNAQNFRVLGSLTVGYLHRPLQHGVMFRVLYKPTKLLGTEETQNCFLVSLGYSF